MIQSQRSSSRTARAKAPDVMREVGEEMMLEPVEASVLGDGKKERNVLDLQIVDNRRTRCRTRPTRA